MQPLTPCLAALLLLAACPSPPDENERDAEDLRDDEGDDHDPLGLEVDSPDTDVMDGPDLDGTQVSTETAAPLTCPAGCDDGNPCTDDLCVDGACAHVANLVRCDDGDACTLDDRCHARACVGLALDCDDDNACTVDHCDGGECRHAAADGACDDGDACTIGDHCQGGLCQGAALECPAGLCELASCDPRTGCATIEREGPCDDGDACTTGDTCGGGACRGVLERCDDGNPCTDDYCDPAVGCVARNNRAPCDDGNPCSGPDRCQDGACEAGPAQACCAEDAACDDGEGCTDDRCEAGRCEHTPKACDDGDRCSLDRCAGGLCEHVAWGPWPASGLVVEDFEAGLGAWTVVSDNPVVGWQLDTSWAESGSTSLYCGDPATRSYDHGVTLAVAERVIALPPQAERLELAVEADLGDDGSCLYDVLIAALDGVELGRVCASGRATSSFEVGAWAGREAVFSLTFATRDATRNTGAGVWVDALRLTGSAGFSCP